MNMIYPIQSHLLTSMQMNQTKRTGRESDFALLKKGLDSLLGPHTHLTEEYKYHILLDHLEHPCAVQVARRYIHDHTPYSSAMRALLQRPSFVFPGLRSVPRPLRASVRAVILASGGGVSHVPPGVCLCHTLTPRNYPGGGGSVIIQQEEEDPVIIQQEEEDPVIIQQEEEDPVIIQQEEEDPVIIQQEEEDPVIIQQEEEDPVIIQQEEDPVIIQQEEEDL
uniref:Uncharacterized protein n=1 Tax=Knipowitschia caucasica TaxID=637954 RepID=A0AAV2KNL7_KNICA